MRISCWRNRKLGIPGCELRPQITEFQVQNLEFQVTDLAGKESANLHILDLSIFVLFIFINDYFP